jgi:FtsH-binding integral membrane protein
MLDIKNFNSLVRKKKVLLKCIFSTLIAQIIVTTIVVYFLYKFRKIHLTLNLLTFLIVFGINIYLIFLMIRKNVTFNTRLMYFSIFSVLNGLIIGSLTRYFSPIDIKIALLSVLTIFILFFLFGALTVMFKMDLSWLGIILFICLVALIIRYLVMFIYPVKRETYKMINTFGIVLFSLFIMYDTNKILMRYKNTKVDCVRGALDYYLDLVNLFIRLLRKRR